MYLEIPLCSITFAKNYLDCKKPKECCKLLCLKECHFLTQCYTGMFLFLFIQMKAECSLTDLRLYRYIHCFDLNYNPIDAVSLGINLVSERTSCLVSCNHERALSTWKKCISGTWLGSDIDCKGRNFFLRLYV